jgi:acyl-CoA synthetase (AMP-forming)/AMP-acid ligase II
LSSIVDLLRSQSSRLPDVIAYTFRSSTGEISESITYRDLDERARAFATYLASCTSPGDRALLLYPAGIDYIVALFGSLYAGVVAVPSYPPTGIKAKTVQRVADLARDAGARIALTTDSLADRHEWTTAVDDLSWHSVPFDLPGATGSEPFGATSDDLAILQYSSGSTGMPKGVMISHGNLLSNVGVIADGCASAEGTNFVSWLPLYHDMGLITGVLYPVLVGGTQHLMSPTAFLRRPLVWLGAISSERATMSAAPNFAYELCLRRISAAEADHLDLSGWSIAVTGAEPVRAETLRRFSRAFARCGFRRETMFACYGLAEATCAVSGGDIRSAPTVVRIDRAALQTGSVRTTDAPDDGLEVVGCGRPYLDHSIAIVSDGGTVCAADQVGEVWVTGSSVARGYWGKPELSERVFRGRLPGDDRSWLRTGDLGFQRGGELFLVGRSSDLIIIRGRNHAPEDIETTVGACSEQVEPGGVVAFGVEHEGEEHLALVVALVRGAGPNPDLGRLITHEVADSHGVQVHDIAFVRGSEIPRTSSGKLKRRACRDAFARGELSGQDRRGPAALAN